ncbi:Tubulin polyglutamylase ttll-4 [Intoshia linei]|uniref:Tubulin polyglutamylase ttll-4 n=1 Tax=Intoshia linei TaxID=1819745 RepID=A0A177AY51_9BILA|nr:Tubulin polyglutamylase ttll-4 [Intoshia linei]
MNQQTGTEKNLKLGYRNAEKNNKQILYKMINKESIMKPDILLNYYQMIEKKEKMKRPKTKSKLRNSSKIDYRNNYIKRNSVNNLNLIKTMSCSNSNIISNICNYAKIKEKKYKIIDEPGSTSFHNKRVLFNEHLIKNSKYDSLKYGDTGYNAKLSILTPYLEKKSNYLKVNKDIIDQNQYYQNSLLKYLVSLNDTHNAKKTEQIYKSIQNYKLHADLNQMDKKVDLQEVCLINENPKKGNGEIDLTVYPNKQCDNNKSKSKINVKSTINIRQREKVTMEVKQGRAKSNCETSDETDKKMNLIKNKYNFITINSNLYTFSPEKYNLSKYDPIGLNSKKKLFSKYCHYCKFDCNTKFSSLSNHLSDIKRYVELNNECQENYSKFTQELEKLIIHSNSMACFNQCNNYIKNWIINLKCNLKYLNSDKQEESALLRNDRNLCQVSNNQRKKINSDNVNENIKFIECDTSRINVNIQNNHLISKNSIETVLNETVIPKSYAPENKCIAENYTKLQPISNYQQLNKETTINKDVFNKYTNLNNTSTNLSHVGEQRGWQYSENFKSGIHNVNRDHESLYKKTDKKVESTSTVNDMFNLNEPNKPKDISSKNISNSSYYNSTQYYHKSIIKQSEFNNIKNEIDYFKTYQKSDKYCINNGENSSSSGKTTSNNDLKNDFKNKLYLTKIDESIKVDTTSECEAFKSEVSSINEDFDYITDKSEVTCFDEHSFNDCESNIGKYINNCETDSETDSHVSTLSEKELVDKYEKTDVKYYPAFTASIFPYTPAVINFVLPKERQYSIPWKIRKHFRWKNSTITPNILKSIILRSGFRFTNKDNWIGVWGKHMRSNAFKLLNENQKANNNNKNIISDFRRNVTKLQIIHGSKEINFLPQTYVLPWDYRSFKRCWEDGGFKEKWIIKPPASARGIGIKVVHKWNQIPKKRAVIVQKYISKPLLINGRKFDIRLYVYITSIYPLKIYLYDEGLTRFASCKYSNSVKSLMNRYIHLTNYSINKHSSSYEPNSDENACIGHKWSLKSLWRYLENRNINTEEIKKSIIDLIIKTIIASEPTMYSMCQANVKCNHMVHELFGFDILIDENLCPWLLEVNISPSLHSNSELDVAIKGRMIRNVMNISGYMLPPKNEIKNYLRNNKFDRNSIPTPYIFHDSRLCQTTLSTDQKNKHIYFSCQSYEIQVQHQILEILTPDDIRHLIQYIDEDARKQSFQRIFPTEKTQIYSKYFQIPRYYNLLLNRWNRKYHKNWSLGNKLLQKMCKSGIHFKTIAEGTKYYWVPPKKFTVDSRLSKIPPLSTGQLKSR